MTASFSTTKLLNGRVLVRGTDRFDVTGETVLSSEQWDEVNAHKQYDLAADAYDRAVEEFFAPIMEAGEQLEKAVSRKPQDSVGYVVLREPVEGVQPEPGHIVKLNKASIVLRLIEQGSYDRLVWVGTELEILEAIDTPAPAAPAGDTAPDQQ